MLPRDLRARSRAAPSTTRRARPIPFARTAAPAARACHSAQSGRRRAGDARVCRSANARSTLFCDRARASGPRRAEPEAPARSALRASRSLIQKAASEAKPSYDPRSDDLEWIVDTRENCGAFAAPSDVDVPDHERLRDSAKSDAADRMQVLERIVAHLMTDASRFGEWRQLEYPVSAENVFIPNSRAHLEVHHE